MRRGFTLVEVMIVSAILLLLVAPIHDLLVSGYRAFHHDQRVAGLKLEARSCASQAFARARRLGGCRVAEDNHGLLYPDGSGLRWNGAQVLLGQGSRQRSMFSSRVRVTDFTAIRAGGILYLSVRLEQGGLRYRAAFDDSEVGR